MGWAWTSSTLERGRGEVNNLPRLTSDPTELMASLWGGWAEL